MTPQSSENDNPVSKLLEALTAIGARERPVLEALTATAQPSSIEEAISPGMEQSPPANLVVWSQAPLDGKGERLHVSKCEEFGASGIEPSRLESAGGLEPDNLVFTATTPETLEAVSRLIEAMAMRGRGSTKRALELIKNDSLGVSAFYTGLLYLSLADPGPDQKDNLDAAFESFSRVFEIEDSGEELERVQLLSFANTAEVMRAMAEASSGPVQAAYLEKACSTYEQFASAVSDDPALALTTHFRLGVIQRQMSGKCEKKEQGGYIVKAVKSLEFAVDLVSFEDDPEKWGKIQKELGETLSVAGMVLTGDDRIGCLEGSEEAYWNALEVYTREKDIWQWANIHNNMGNTLEELAGCLEGEARLQRLLESVAAFRNALDGRPKEKSSYDWAVSQNNLGNTLCLLAVEVSGEKGKQFAEESIKCYDNAMGVFDETFPQHYNEGLGMNKTRAMLVMATMKGKH